MPLYEYQCDQCGHRFELIRKFSDPAVETCPKCGGHVQKLISASAFQLKGSGWYITDYARKDSPGAAKGENASKESSKESGDKSSPGANAQSDSKKESKSESASESKTDAKKEEKQDGGKAAASSSDSGSSTSKT